MIEQITYLLFARRLDDLHTAKEAQANLLKEPIKDPLFKKTQQHLRWSRFKDMEAQEMYQVFRDEVFPFIKSLNKDETSAYSCSEYDAEDSSASASGSKACLCKCKTVRVVRHKDFSRQCFHEVLAQRLAVKAGRVAVF